MTDLGTDSTDTPQAPNAPKIIDELRPFLARATYAVDTSPAVDLVFHTLAVAARPADEELIDSRWQQGQEIADLLTAATPAVRTRAAQVVSALIPMFTRIRSLILATKEELLDPDVATGDAELRPDGWLVVTMEGAEIAKVPFDPARGPNEAARVAEEILSEHVRLHVAAKLEPDVAPASGEIGTIETTEDDGTIVRLISTARPVPATAPAAVP